MSDENITMEELYDAGYMILDAGDGWAWDLVDVQDGTYQRGDDGHRTWKEARDAAAKHLAESRKPKELTGRAYIDSLCERYADDGLFAVTWNEGNHRVRFILCGCDWHYVAPNSSRFIAVRGSGSWGNEWRDAECTVFGPSDVPGGDRFEAYVGSDDYRHLFQGRALYAEPRRCESHTHKLAIFAEPLDQTK